jgi:hypothetical protein
MVQSRRRRGVRGLVGTPMGGPGGRRQTGEQGAERSDHTCPDCLAVPGQPCRTITSASGAAVLRLGKVRPTMHVRRTGGPVEISKIDPARGAFVPRNQRPGFELGRTDRLGQDSIPRGRRTDAKPRDYF